VAEDDHSRYVHVEQHPREVAETNAACLERALVEFRELGLDAPQAVMSDNAKVYGSNRFQAVLATVDARHILTPPYTPRWNGKLCVLASGCRPVGR
jgi:transposase InsO family protein